jgi:hypothetical protein
MRARCREGGSRPARIHALPTSRSSAVVAPNRTKGRTRSSIPSNRGDSPAGVPWSDAAPEVWSADAKNTEPGGVRGRPARAAGAADSPGDRGCPVGHRSLVLELVARRPRHRRGDAGLDGIRRVSGDDDDVHGRSDRLRRSVRQHEQRSPQLRLVRCRVWLGSRVLEQYLRGRVLSGSDALRHRHVRRSRSGPQELRHMRQRLRFGLLRHGNLPGRLLGGPDAVPGPVCRHHERPAQLRIMRRALRLRPGVLERQVRSRNGGCRGRLGIDRFDQRLGIDRCDDRSFTRGVG